MSRPVMCHVVAGYPDPETCLELMLGLQASGAAALEVQIPFSDPIADGATIMRANDVALEHGMTTAGSFDLIKQARRQGLSTDLYIMSYVQKIRHHGLSEFCRRAAAVEAKGLIVPDMPYDSPEFAQLSKLAAKRQLGIVPVLSPGMSEPRLRAILALKPACLYITTTRGITGSKYSPANQLKQLVSEIRQHSGAQLMVGFGIATPDDVGDALQQGDLAVVGSAVIKKLQASDVEQTLAYVRTLTAANS